MVSKLILAVEEKCQAAIQNNESTAITNQLIEYYYDTRNGLGTSKTPDNYGAFPTDPYSHTPGNAGAQQPGMTGQVKEDILSRFGELGVKIKDGEIFFNPRLLKQSEFLNEEATFSYFDIHNEKNQIVLPEGTLAFTYCQVPVIYQLGDEQNIEVFFEDGKTAIIDHLNINKDWSSQMFRRTGNIIKVKVNFNASNFVFA